jgi:hypothetical protein
MKTLQPATDNVQEPKREAQQHKDTYRAPRLVALGTAVDLVQGSRNGLYLDGYQSGYSNIRN